MQKKIIKKVLVVFCVLTIGLVSSCKTHEVCPAYTKVEVEQPNF